MSYSIRLNGCQEDNYVLELRARMVILCAHYLYSVIKSTPSPWDSGSQVESTPSPWDSGSRINKLSQECGKLLNGQESGAW